MSPDHFYSISVLRVYLSDVSVRFDTKKVSAILCLNEWERITYLPTITFVEYPLRDHYRKMINEWFKNSSFLGPDSN